MKEYFEDTKDTTTIVPAPVPGKDVSGNTPAPAESNNNNALYIGLSVFGGLFLFIVILIFLISYGPSLESVHDYFNKGKNNSNSQTL